jgi:putative flippase GtrA
MPRAQGAPGGADRALLGEGARFLVIGVVNSAFGFGVFVALQATLGTVTHYLVVLVVAQVIAVLEAYVLQRVVVFRARGRWWRDLVRFSGVYVVALGVNAVLLPLLVEVAKLPVLLAQAIVMAAVALGTFVVHRSFTFRHSRASGQVADASGKPTDQPSTRSAARMRKVRSAHD